MIGKLVDQHMGEYKAAMRAIIPDALQPEFLQAGSADQRKETMAAGFTRKEAEAQETQAQRDMSSAAGEEEEFLDRVVEARKKTRLAELEKAAEEQEVDLIIRKR